MRSTTILIIGGGFTGSVLALHLRRACPDGTSICVVERSGRPGPGLAHATGQDAHLLNVPVARMSALPDQPSHFHDWLAARPDLHPGGPGLGDAFVQRRVYGTYLAELMARARAKGDIEVRHDQAIGVARGADGLQVRLAGGDTLRADFAVLATGNGPTQAPHPDAVALEQAGLWRRDPWDRTVLDGLDRKAPVLFIGAGQTMVDLAAQLLRRGHVGPITALSRNGLLPRAFLEHPSPAYELPPLPKRLGELLRTVRRAVAAAEAAGLTWHGVIDSLAPLVQEMWRGLSRDEQRRFMRHLRPMWEVHRHRMPPVSAERLDAARATGQFRLVAGRLDGVTIRGGQAEVRYRQRGDGTYQVVRADRVVNCTGPSRDVGRYDDPLFQSLLREGLCRAHPLLLGLDVTDEGALLDAAGVASERLFTLGPMTRGLWWEVTAVPYIRVQCRNLALVLSERCRERAATGGATVRA